VYKELLILKSELHNIPCTKWCEIDCFARKIEETSADDEGSYRLQQDATRANRGARPLIRIPLRLSSSCGESSLYRSEPRTVFGALNRRCPKPILEDGCDINRQGRQDETRDGRYLVGERIKSIETKPVGNMMIHHEVVVLEPKWSLILLILL